VLPYADTPPPASATHPRILLVEDLAEHAQVVVDGLESCGYQVHVTPCGDNALTQAQAVSPALMIIDIQLPGIDGLTLIRHLREDAQLCPIPILALTALASPGDRERCLAAGANAYLAKPVSLKQLVELIQGLIQP